MIYEPFMRSGAEMILAIQAAAHPTVTMFMHAVTFLGVEMFYLLAISFLFWCVDQRFAIRMLILVIVSSFINNTLKLAIHSPRPYWWEPEIHGMVPEHSYGPPSGHSQNGVTVWCYIAYHLNRAYKRGWIWPLFIMIAFLISFSRVYLGAHFPHSLILGWIIGAIVLVTFIKVEDGLQNWFAHNSKRIQVSIALLASFSLIGVAFLVRYLVNEFGANQDATWLANAAQDQPGHDGKPAIDPRSLNAMVSQMGSLAGALIGGMLYQRTARFQMESGIGIRILRYVVGIIGLFIIYVGLSKLFPREPELPALGFRFVRYFLMILWAIWLAPLVFLKIGLAKPAEASA